MLAVSPMRKERDDETRRGESCFSIGGDDDEAMLLDFADANDLLDSIDFDDIFAGDDDALPDLEIDAAEFSACFEDLTEVNPNTTRDGGSEELLEAEERFDTAEFSEGFEDRTEVNLNTTWDGGSEESSEAEERSAGAGAGASSSGEEGSEKKREGWSGGKRKEEGDRRRKRSAAADAQGKTNPQAQGKRKVKVDWTPDLHRRFVQAVEQLGVDKAVPSRILELMGIDSLTRHNIASHLQKYRSQRRHLLSLETDVASWSKRRHIYGGATAATGGSKRVMTPWAGPAMGFPPAAPSVHHHFRPLHVWGHPTPSPSLKHGGTWPKHPFHSQPPHVPPPLPTWASPPPPHHPPPPPPPPPPGPSYWHQQGFGFAPVPGIPHHQGVYKVDPSIGVPMPAQQLASSQPSFDFHQWKESVDAAVGEVLSKPWQPLPLGLKPPSLDGVLGELQRQGIPSILPTFLHLD